MCRVSTAISRRACQAGCARRCKSGFVQSGRPLQRQLPVGPEPNAVIEFCDRLTLTLRRPRPAASVQSPTACRLGSTMPTTWSVIWSCRSKTSSTAPSYLSAQSVRRPPCVSEQVDQRIPAIGLKGIVTMASFTCQWRDALMGRTQRNQWLAELESGAGHIENPLFLADVTMPARSGSSQAPSPKTSVSVSLFTIGLRPASKSRCAKPSCG